ncbi:UdgX family uracil-DNA binding protein [Streptomyces gobiensis]|uniref:UdgX family uracil-DNA binding protein n=1 Tax=Streptomyces gobiensis TaxID=2875706 RepID=UPI001E362034|nr:UdgX family uracil-DNA binding protein [Streptomyces gobiensis]UGY94597.1 UdgX family uracil-DNA binding protein [Streptomyces gobiensis]
MHGTEKRGPEAYDAGPFVPEGADLDALRRAAADCQGCPLFREATQTVFSSGDASARVVLIGEQPGDQEDRRGQPFVGPAGRVLMHAVDEAGIDPTQTYVTNAVKHFKFVRMEERGKRRIHKPPSLREMTACKPWLTAELNLIDPEVVVALGATAGKALLGSSFRVTKQRGVLLPMPDWGGGSQAANGSSNGGAGLVATIHPSAVLRADDRDRDAVYAGLVADLRIAAEALR